MLAGYISIHRKLLEWEYYSDINVKVLFIHILLKANWQDKQWKGITIRRGDFITGREQLSRETGLSVAQVRSALDKLKIANNITIATTSKYSVITVVNYELYQNLSPVVSQQITNKSPTNHQQITTTNKVNNIININNTLMSEIKISDDRKFFEVKENRVPATDEEIRNFSIAENCRKIFLKNQTDAGAPTTHQDKAKYSAYVTPIRLMIDVDGVNTDQIKEALKYLKSEAADFWKPNCLSTTKFREHISQLVAKRNFLSKNNKSKGVPRL